jgi:hypothetical protein
MNFAVSHKVHCGRVYNVNRGNRSAAAVVAGDAEVANVRMNRVVVAAAICKTNCIKHHHRGEVRQWQI